MINNDKTFVTITYLNVNVNFAIKPININSIVEEILYNIEVEQAGSNLEKG